MVHHTMRYYLARSQWMKQKSLIRSSELEEITPENLLGIPEDQIIESLRLYYHLCTECGQPLTPAHARTMCPECRKQYRMEHKNELEQKRKWQLSENQRIKNWAGEGRGRKRKVS